MVLGPRARPGDELLLAVHDKPIAATLGLCPQRARVGAATGFGETIARQDLHRGEAGKPGAPLCRGAESVHHPGAHVVHGKIGRDARAARRQGLENENRVEAGKTRTAKLLARAHRRHPQRRRLAQGFDGKIFLPVPLQRPRRDFLAREP